MPVKTTATQLYARMTPNNPANKPSVLYSTLQVIKLLESIELRPARYDMERVLDELEWTSIKANDDVLFALFRAAFR